MLSLYSHFPHHQFVDNLFEMAHKHHNNPEDATDIENLCREIESYVEKNANDESFADIILSTFDTHKEETESFAKWVGHYSKAYPGKELQITGLYEPIHKLLNLDTQKVSNVATSLLQQIDSACVKHVEKISFPNDILTLILKKHIKNYSPKELQEVKTTCKKFHLLSFKHAKKHFNSLESAGIRRAKDGIQNVETKNPKFVNVSNIFFTKEEFTQFVKCLPNLNTLIAQNFILDDQKEDILVNNLPNLVELDLSFQDTRSYNVGALSKLQNLKYLSLSDTQINSDDIIPLYSLTNLKELDLSDNFISKIPLEFKNLTSLEHLNLSNLKDRNCFQCTTLQDLKNLKSLFLSNDDKKLKNSEALCALNSLRELLIKGIENVKFLNNLYRLNKLEHLSLRHNQLSSEDLKKIALLSNLKTLDLSYNRICEIPQEVTLLSALEDLYLSSQHTEKKSSYLGIENIKILSSLKNLDYLDLSNCNLAPNNITLDSFELPKNLKELDLGFTKTGSKLLEKVSACTNLVKLRLYGNKIICEDLKTLGTLSNLITLDLNGNCLSQIPQEFSNLKSLETLDLHSQEIEEEQLNCSHLSQLNALKHLYLWDNSIDPKGMESLHTLHNLESLYLFECDLGPVELQIFQLPVNLKELDLAFTKIGPEILRQIGLLKKLEYLNLRECQLGKLSLESFQLPESLKHLVLHDNNFESNFITNLLSLKNLTHLDIRDKKNLSLEDLKALTALNLTNLKLSLECIDDNCVEIFRTFEKLEKLTICCRSHIQNAAAKLKNLSNIKKISLTQ